MTYSHAAIIPLIGGEAIASERVFGSRPDYILSYSVFKDNEKHLLNYWNNEVPYYVLDEGQRHPHRVDVVSSVCPCAGISQLSTTAGSDNPANKWMIQTAEYVLSEMRPRVFWGENAPGLVGNIGKGVREKLYNIGRKNGYSLLLYRTKNLLHGVPQVRNRTFYFFVEGDRTPVFEFYDRPYTPIEDLIRGVKSNFQTEAINPKRPSEDPYYQYVLEEMHGGITHKEFSEIVPVQRCRDNDIASYIEKSGISYATLSEWMKKKGYDREVERCNYRHAKLEAGGSLMRRGVTIPKDYIGAFVGHYPHMLTHPDEDRFISYREAMTIMGLPDDYELLDPKKSINHMCQNVPVQTATDMANEVLAYLNSERCTIDTTIAVQYNTNKTMDYDAAPVSLEHHFE